MSSASISHFSSFVADFNHSIIVCCASCAGSFSIAMFVVPRLTRTFVRLLHTVRAMSSTQMRIFFLTTILNAVILFTYHFLSVRCLFLFHYILTGFPAQFLKGEHGAQSANFLHRTPIGWWGLATLEKAYHFQIDLPTLKYAEISIVIDKKPPRL